MLIGPVIYAEDDENDAYFMRRAFEQAGIVHPLVILPDGQQAVDYLAGVGEYADREKHPYPCLVLLDLKLPIKSGFDVLRWIEENGLKLPKVIVVSASAQTPDIELAKKLGALDYVIKPSTPAELIEIVRRIRDQWLA